jgi:hypothetical protein
LFGIRLVLYALRNDEHFTRRHMNRAIAKIDPIRRTPSNSMNVSFRVLMIVADEVSLQFHDFKLVVMHFGHDLRRR